MKKLISIFVIVSLIFATSVQTATAQAGGISKGEKYTNYSFPDSITASKTVLFPTATSVAKSWTSDSANLKVGEFYTYVVLDSVKATRRVKLSNQGYLTGGAQLVIDAVSDTTRSLIIVQASGNDTISVANRKKILLYYTGSKWVPVGTY